MAYLGRKGASAPLTSADIPAGSVSAVKVASDVATQAELDAVGLTATTALTPPSLDSNPSAVGHLWINSATGYTYICTDISAGNNVWKSFDAAVITKNELRHNDNMWFYADFSLPNPVSGTNIINKATGTVAIADVIPMAGGTIQSAVGSTVLQYNTNTNASRTNFTAADPFSPSTHGLSMGCLFKKSSASKGLIYYGDGDPDNHFFVRTDYNTASTIAVGEDTGGSDVWTTAETSVADNSWFFFVVTITTSGTMQSSLNGSTLHTIRTDGTAPTPTDALFGIQGDPYNDNANQNDYAQIFFYKGLITQTEIATEYAYLKQTFSGASLP